MNLITTKTTATGFTIEISPPTHRMENHPLSSENCNSLRKITAPDGSHRIVRHSENFTIFDGFSDDARQIIDAMTDEQFAEILL